MSKTTNSNTLFMSTANHVNKKQENEAPGCLLFWRRACKISPVTRSSMTWLSSWMTSLSRSAASVTLARASRKSPARMATCGAVHDYF